MKHAVKIEDVSGSEEYFSLGQSAFCDTTLDMNHMTSQIGLGTGMLARLN